MNWAFLIAKSSRDLSIFLEPFNFVIIYQFLEFFFKHQNIVYKLQYSLMNTFKYLPILTRTHFVLCVLLIQHFTRSTKLIPIILKDYKKVKRNSDLARKPPNVQPCQPLRKRGKWEHRPQKSTKNPPRRVLKFANE